MRNAERGFACNKDVCFLCGSISSFRFVFFDPKKESNMQSEYANSDRICLRFAKGRQILATPVVRFLAQNLTTWVIRFSNRKIVPGMVSKFKILSTTANRSRTIDELVGNTVV